MNAENTEQLFTDFPKLYSELDDFECDDSWFDIIYNLSVKLCDLAERSDYEPDEVCFCEHVHYPKASQVKIKFDGLRFYAYDLSKDMKELIYRLE